MRGKNVPRQKRTTGRLRRASAIVVSHHFLYTSALGGTLNPSPYLSATPQNCKARNANECLRLIEIVTNFPEELMIAICHPGVSDLIRAVQCEF